MPVQDIDSLIQASLNGEKLPTARLISLVERGDPQAPYIMGAISPHSGTAYYIGVTGPPGAGKSTTVDRLVAQFSRNNYSVGVIAVDPTSPFTGGALLGDRIRMNAGDTDRDVFFRSMSSGRAMGGLARTTREAAKILDAGGRQIIIIETVGVGQSELDIAQSTDTVLVVLMPESGDHIQMMKAGLMEIADVFAVNKADRPGAEHIAGTIRELLERSSPKPEWRPTVFLTSASLNKGIPALYEGLWAHHRHLQQNSRLEERRKSQLKNELRSQIRAAFSEIFWQKFAKENDMDFLLQDIWAKKSDPRAAASQIVAKWVKDKIKV